MKLIHTLRLIKMLSGQLWKDVRSPNQSYSQHGEDLVVQEILGTVQSFVDIGANDGITFSNTRRFARQKAVGLCFEPAPITYWRCRFFNLPFPKVNCVRGGVSNYEGCGVVEAEGYQGLLTSITQTTSAGTGTKPKVQMDTLNGWITRKGWLHSVDLVSIDVEGGEESVLRGIDFGSFSSKVWVIETDKTGVPELNAILRPEGYSPLLTNGLNTIWVGCGVADATQVSSIVKKWPEWSAVA